MNKENNFDYNDTQNQTHMTYQIIRDLCLSWNTLLEYKDNLVAPEDNGSLCLKERTQTSKQTSMACLCLRIFLSNLTEAIAEDILDTEEFNKYIESYPTLKQALQILVSHTVHDHETVPVILYHSAYPKLYRYLQSL